MSSSNASAKKKPRRSSIKKKQSDGSMLYSLGMSGGTVKKTRKASKSPRRTAVKKSPRTQGKRVSKQIVKKKLRTKKPAGGLVANTKRTQVAGKKKEASQAREMMQLKQQLAAAEEKLKKSQANEKTLVHMVGELESENTELLQAHQSEISNSGQLLADAKKDIAELKKQLRDALNARYEYEKLRANDQNDISELKRQLADALATIEELKADIKTKDEKLEKSQVTEYADEIEQLSEQKTDDSPPPRSNVLLTISRKFFRGSAAQRHGQPLEIPYVAEESCEDSDYSNESPTGF